jgi:hypothetical protein
VYIECKPALGDDFPAVLRQVKAYDYRDDGLVYVRRCVAVQRYSFERVQYEDVARMFAASGIHLLPVSSPGSSSQLHLSP